VVNLTTTAYLLGMCPLFIGMQIRLSRTLQNTPLLVREVTGTVRNIQFHDREPSDWRGRDATQLVVLRYLPNAVVVELDAADMRSTTFCEGLAPGYIIIPPEEGQWTWRRIIATEATKSGRAVLQTEMLRRQIPLAPRFVNTHFGLQGQIARKGMLAYCQKPKGMSDGDYFLAIYVLLSRATKLDDLLLVGMPARQLFEKGLLALPVLQQRMKALEDRAAEDSAAAEGIMTSLDWPKPQHFDDAFAAAASHEP
jgi:hypothetical protein